jgi:energy-coupling factor transport system ATP-binding protein
MDQVSDGDRAAVTYPIEIRGLSFRYEGSAPLLKDIDLVVNEGEILAIVGLSGAGKSTLCYCMSGIIPHVYKGVMEGEVLINGVSTRELTLPKISTALGIVFQNPDNQLFSPTVEDEIAFGPENLCIPREEIGVIIDKVLKQVGVEKYRHSTPHKLSGGQKQLIALAAVLSLDPDILIFDEAASQIDAAGKRMVKDVILKLKESGKTIVSIEHDFDNLDIADKLMLLSQGSLRPFEGRLH